MKAKYESNVHTANMIREFNKRKAINWRELGTFAGLVSIGVLSLLMILAVIIFG